MMYLCWRVRVALGIFSSPLFKQYCIVDCHLLYDENVTSSSSCQGFRVLEAISIGFVCAERAIIQEVDKVVERIRTNEQVELSCVSNDNDVGS